jgi:hypothetical protein
MVLIGHSSITLPMLSVSESDVSIASGKLFTFDKYVFQSGTPNVVLCLSFYSFQINALKTYVVENKLERRSAQWIPIDDSEVSSNYPIIRGSGLEFF